ncbi:MAG: ribosome biogenesis GTPase Der [Acidobacteria bacterium]|nr:MAG: ribosome biogenesis GTPase Der [Acidobacteriota bacterium]
MARRPIGPTVVLVGRPNVGKSTLFNRLTGTRRSIVAPIAGTTRDVIQQPAEWQGRHFQLVDTGGLFGATKDPLHAMVVAHGLKALRSADILVFVVDGREGIQTGDEEIAQQLRKYGHPVVLAVNKTDAKKASQQAATFSKFGFQPLIEVSAEHGEGIGELLDAVTARFPKLTAEEKAAHAEDAVGAAEDFSFSKGLGDSGEEEEAEVVEPDEDQEIAVAIVGRPNVGKSSLVNRLVKAERVMVSDMPGTTRDAVDVVLNWHKKRFRIVDTAGMRKPGKVFASGPIENVSVLIAKRAMMRAQVAVLVLDAVEGATDRDAAIAGEAQELGLGLIIAINKWDLVKGRGEDWVKKFDDKLRFMLKFLDYVPLIHMSALTGDRTSRLLATIDRIATARKKKVPTAQLNKFIERVVTLHPPTTKGKKDVKIMYATQTAIEPPEFVIFTNVADDLHFSYERYLTNALREEFGFEGTPIRLKVRRRAKKARP